MKQMRKKAAILLPALLMLLSGCMLKSDDDLYRIPKAPKEFEDLTKQIAAVQEQGAEYSAPLTGENIQNVQLQDLDGDGEVDSAIAFFRMNGQENPLKIYIYRQLEDRYELMAIIEGSGTAINYVTYENLDNNPDKEIVVTWQLSDQAHFLSAYSVSEDQVVELLHTDYVSFKLSDMDRDNDQEILIVNTRPESGPQVELYDFQDGLMELDSAAPLSAGIADPKDSAVQRGYLRDSVPALFVTSNLFDELNERNTFRTTDIFVWEGKKDVQGPEGEKSLRNVTLDGEKGYSHNTVSSNSAVVGPMDINRDSIMELSQSIPIEEYRQTSMLPSFWLNRWSQYDIDGTAHYVGTTYYNDRDGWYLILPDEWEGKISLSRRDAAGGGERAVVFSYWDKERQAEPVPFLTIYRLTGSNRESRVLLPGRFRLADSGEDMPSTIYAACFEEGGWDCGLTEETLREHFQVIRADWGSSD
ncbi:hypothetical protein D1159_12785 [Pseudoflavonifractor sp. 524-17]|uniref:hypothetical protein n=1 Tax=Pseudoflavonifractor sp. 524-17 TaxID=2304577 RepID=UPI00137A9B04|nr:hypothetical protein [Pseudoflavonifractor sp. 524-17]NCE65427.1 hypothetical protein [Pseudoflavonifractor sp. 524-17]